MVCNSCGYGLSEEDDFCPKCGKKVMSANADDFSLCWNCGNRIPNNVSFCSKCGNSKYDNKVNINEVTSEKSSYTKHISWNNDNGPQSGAEMVSQKGEATDYTGTTGNKPNSYADAFFFFAAILTSIACVILLFLNWIEVPALRYFGSDETLSIFKLFDWSSTLSEYITALEGIHYFIGIVAALFVISMILNALTVFFIATKSQRSSTCGSWALFSVILSFLLLCLSMLILNDYLGRESYGIITSVVNLTPIAYITLVLAVLNRAVFIRLFMKKVTSNLQKKNQLISKNFLLLLLSTLFIIIVDFLIRSYSMINLEMLGFSFSSSAIVTTGYSIASVLAFIFAGYLSDVYGRKVIIIIGAIITTVASFLFLLSFSFIPLLVCSILQGVGVATVICSLLAAISDNLPTERVGEGIGYFWLIYFVASSFSTIFGSIIIDSYGYRSIFTILSLVSLLVVFVAIFYKSKKVAPSVAASFEIETQASQVRTSGLWNFVDKTTLPIAFIEFLVSFSTVAISLFFTYFLHGSWEVASDENITIYNLTILGTVLLVRLIITLTRVLNRENQMALLVPAFVCGFLSLTISCFITFPISQGLLIIIAVLSGVWLGITVPTLCSAIFKKASSERRGAASSIFLIAGGLAGGIGNMILGSLADTSFIITFIFGILIIAIAFAFTYMFTKKKIL